MSAWEEGHNITRAAVKIPVEYGHVDSRGYVNPRPEMRRFVQYHDPQRLNMLYYVLESKERELLRLREELARCNSSAKAPS